MKNPLPDSAGDLLIKDGKHLMRSLSLYEVLRRFGHIIRLSPFRFEDFTAALLADDQSVLLAEIHIQLLKTLVREDRQQQTWLGPPDIRDSVNLYLHLADHSNWPAALRIYLSADTYNNAYVLDELDCEEERCYPFGVDLETRLNVLEQLCDQFLMSVLARDEIDGRGINEKPETNCRLCSKANGDLIACGLCAATYHLKCSDPPLETYPDLENETHLCALCRSNHVKGVTDCISDEEKTGTMRRHDAIGMDKSGRSYWFIARRLFVVDETEDDVRYYTTAKQLAELIESLQANRHEKNLIENILAQQTEIERQMQITDDLYATLMKDQLQGDGTYSLALGQDGNHRCYTNHYLSAPTPNGKSHSHDRDISRSLNNKFCLTSPLKWFGATDGTLKTITLTVRTSILKFETQLPQTFIHPCWQNNRAKWIKFVTNAHRPTDLAIALTQLETCIKPVLFKAAWYDSVGFVQLIRSTFLEREELRKIDRQPRGFERNERVAADFELSERLGTMVKFSSKLKPVKHQVWKQKGEEYRLTGLNGWYWRGITHRPRSLEKPKIYRNEPHRMAEVESEEVVVANVLEDIKQRIDVVDVAVSLSIVDEKRRIMYPKRPVVPADKHDGVKKMEALLELKLKQLDEAKKIKKESGEGATANNVQSSSPSAYNITPAKNANGCGAGDTNKVVGPLTIINCPNGVQRAGDSRNKINSFNLSPVSGDGDNSKKQQQQHGMGGNSISKMTKPKLLPYHNFKTKQGKVRSLFVLPDIELSRLARSGGLKEARTFNYMAKPNYYIWPYGMTPRPTFRTCWLYRNQLVTSIQDVSLQLKVFHSCIRWDDLSIRPPQSGRTTIVTDDSTITIELLKKRDRLPYLIHSEYLIRKTTTPNELPTKQRKVSTKKSSSSASTPAGRSGLRARRPVEVEEEKKPAKEEVWVSEYQLELWELKQFDERIERQKALMRERALREEAERRRRVDEERRRATEMARRKLKAEQDEVSKRARLSMPIMNYQKTPSSSDNRQTPKRPTVMIKTNDSNQNSPATGSQQQPAGSTPVLRYFRTEQGQIIRLPASYLQRGTPLILRHVSPGTNQTNTYIIRPQTTTITAPAPTMNNMGLRLVTPANLTPASNSNSGGPLKKTEAVGAVGGAVGAAPAVAPAAATEGAPAPVPSPTVPLSVGTVANEMAHDRHAPSNAGTKVVAMGGVVSATPTLAAAQQQPAQQQQQQQQQQQHSSENQVQ